MAVLEITDGVGAGQRLPLPEGQIVSIGRDDQCTYQILDPHISRKHLQVGFDNLAGGHYAADYRSANGVMVNDKRIVKPTVLANRDRIRIGQTTLVFRSDDEATEPPAREGARPGEWKRSTLFPR